MSSESDLRSRMRDGEPPHEEIDVARVIRRARLRRAPRLLAVGGAACLAIAAIAVPVSISGLGTGASDSGAFVAEESAGGDEADGTFQDREATMSGLAPADKLNLCTGTVADLPPAANGLVLTMEPVEAQAGVESIETTVTLRNDGAERVTGTTAGAPSLTLAGDGIVLWHSNGPVPMIAVGVDLAPGESLEYQASFQPVECGVEDDASPEGFRADLPALPPGEYSLSAAIDLLPEDGGATQLISGPAVPVILR